MCARGLGGKGKYVIARSRSPECEEDDSTGSAMPRRWKKGAAKLGSEGNGELREKERCERGRRGLTWLSSSAGCLSGDFVGRPPETRFLKKPRTRRKKLRRKKERGEREAKNNGPEKKKLGGGLRGERC